MTGEAPDSETVSGAGVARAGVYGRAPAGVMLERYTILERIGKGGMGEVYSAYDARLDRKIALKLLRAREEEYETRLVREAQAMARLSHPNVVAVFDTGHVDGRLYLAMEFVRGQTLRAWQKASPRSVRDLLRVYIEAGQGLAAAHAAGLVHRDFKPDNVLVAEDERIKVTDFGIARAVVEQGTESTASVTRPGASPVPSKGGDDVETPSSTPGGNGVRIGGSLGNPVTVEGTLLGTPGYMAPEQLLCEGVDARTDQFAFSVSLYEALYRQMPFARAHSTFDQITRATLLGDVAEAPKGAGVPAHVRRVLLRGLAPEREARYPSMHALLEDLAKDPAKERRLLTMAFGGAASVAAIVALGVVQYRHAATGRALLCNGSEQEFRGIWDEGRKEQLKQAFLSSGSPIAQDTWPRVERAVDAYSKSWVKMRTEACEATRVRGTQSDETMTLRMACLDRRREGVKAYVDVFATPDKSAILHAVRAAQSMAPIDGCADVATLRMAVRPPEDPVARAKVDALRPRVAEVKALHDAGKYKDALQRAEPAIQEAEALTYRPLEAELRFWSAKALFGMGNHKDAESEGTRALRAAAAGGHQEFVARGAAQLAKDLSSLSRETEGLRWAEFGKAIVEHMGTNPELEGDLETSMAYALWRQDAALALQHDQRARELWEKALKPDNPELGNIYSGISIDYYSLGEYEKSVEFDLRAVAHFERTVGSDHPYLSRSLSNLGGASSDLGRFDEAERYAERCLKLPGTAGASLFNSFVTLAYVHTVRGRYQQALAEVENAKRESQKTLGDHDPYWTANILTYAGAALSELGRHAEAIATQRRVVALREATYDAKSHIVGEAYNLLGSALRAAGNPKEALVYCQRALAIQVAKNHPRAASTHTNVGFAHLDLEHFREAAAAFEQSISTRETKFGKEHPLLAAPLVGLARAQLGLGRAAEAIPNAQRAVALAEKARLAPKLLAEARFALAQATWESDGSHEAAREFALAAKTNAERAEGDTAKLRNEIDAWLTAHP